VLRPTSSTFSKRLVLVTAFLLVSAGIARVARAQACCAGSGVLTPGRLALHEDVLVGTELHASAVLGSYDPGGSYAAQPSGNQEYDFEEDLFAAVRVFRRGQVALLIPFDETWRKEPDLMPSGVLTSASAFGGGIGDMNLSLRYDFLLAGESRFVPGIALLAGLTAPTGRPPSSPNAGTFAVDATGTGAWQGNFGLALEQTFGHWLFNVSELLAWRAPFTEPGTGGAPSIDEALAPQWITLAGGGYVFNNEAAVALFGSYSIEGNPSINGTTQTNGGKRALVLSVSGAYPVRENLRLQASLFSNPPFSGLGAGQTATAGLTFTLIWSWS
jgi:hypothetical protein